MARVEIEEADLLNYRHIHGMVDTIMRQPELRKTFLETAKKANPRLAIPEVDAAAPVLAAVGGIQKRLTDFLAAQTERERKAEEDGRIRAFQSRWADQEQALLRGGWQAKGIEGVKKFAEENGISDLGIAADAFERRNPQPDPARSSGGGWGNLFGGGAVSTEDTFVKDMMNASGQDEGRLDREINATLADIRGAR
jgi:hypothetical protein